MRMLCFEKQDEARPIAWVHPQFSSEFFVQEKNREDAHCPWARTPLSRGGDLKGQSMAREAQRSSSTLAILFSCKK